MQQLDLTPDPELSFFVLRTTLSGKDYDFDFAWNARRELWVVSIRTISGEVLTESQVVRHARNLTSRMTSAERPPGIIFAWSNTADLSPARIGELGSRYGIYYALPDEVA